MTVNPKMQRPLYKCLTWVVILRDSNFKNAITKNSSTTLAKESMCTLALHTILSKVLHVPKIGVIYEMQTAYIKFEDTFLFQQLAY